MDGRRILLSLDLPEYSPDKLLEGNVIQEVLTSSVVSDTFLTHTEYTVFIHKPTLLKGD